MCVFAHPFFFTLLYIVLRRIIEHSLVEVVIGNLNKEMMMLKDFDDKYGSLFFVHKFSF